MPHDSDHQDGGLIQDLALLRARLPRRELLRLALGASLLPLLGCGAEASEGGSDGACTRLPTETAGPYPGDGSNGPNVLTQSGVVRSDIRSSVGTMSGTAQGIPLTVTLTLVDSTNGCAPLAGHALYLWHCDREGRYSLYSPGATNQNYLRGVQESDASGQLTFTTVFPACYAGRWPRRARWPPACSPGPRGPSAAPRRSPLPPPPSPARRRARRRWGCCPRPA